MSTTLRTRRVAALCFTLSAFMSLLAFFSRQFGQPCENSSNLGVVSPRDKELRISEEMTNRNPTSGESQSGKELVGHDFQYSTLNDECDLFPNTSSVLLVMKTGASEAYSKIPIQLHTTLKYLSDFLFFSDMAQNIAGYTIYDSLDTVLSEVKEKNKDFALYHRQKQCPIDQDSCNKNHDVAKQGWELDKYKNIHMAEKAYKMRPNYEWYLFVDADTYVVFPTLVQWLKQMDSSKPHYIGSVAQVAGFPFGHGGSGYLVSQAAMRAMFYGKTEVANKYDETIQHTCCGDYMWSKALNDETGIEVVNAWPVINGEKPSTIPFADDEWCQPIVTMHHVVAEEISAIYALERDQKFKTMRIKDLYHKFVGPQLVEARPDWDNMSDDVYYLNNTLADYEDWQVNGAKTDGLSDEEGEAHKSFNACKTACVSLEDCFQFRYQNGICSIAHKFKHGKPVKKDDDGFKRYMSGWNVEKIEKWVERYDDCAPSLAWPVSDDSPDI